MAAATLADVELSMLRPLTTQEAGYAPGLLARVEAQLRNRISGWDILTTNTQWLARAVQVEADAVSRVLRNPDGLDRENSGTYGYSRNPVTASGVLTILDTEWYALGISDLGSIPLDLDGYTRTRPGYRSEPAR